MLEGIDTNKTEGLHECIIYHYWYFLKLNFRSQSGVCDGCHDMTQNSMSFNDVAIVTTEGNDWRIHLCFMTKSEILDKIKNADLIEKSGQLR